MLSYQAQTVCRILTTGRQPARRKHVDPTWRVQSNNVCKQLESLVHYFCQSIKAPTAIFRDASYYTNEEDVVFLLSVTRSWHPYYRPHLDLNRYCFVPICSISYFIFYFFN